MFALRRPDAERVSHFLARQRTAPLTYPEVGATLAGELPAGYRYDRSSLELGAGDEVWARARDGIDRWRAPAAAGIAIEPPDAPITVGTTVGVFVRLGPVYVLAACRIVAVVDRPDRYGFAYGTLPAHPEEGEELFLVTRDAEGVVRFEITAFSRPHDLLTRLGGPVAAPRATTRHSPLPRGSAHVRDRMTVAPHHRACVDVVSSVPPDRHMFDRGVGGDQRALRASMSLGTTLCTSPTTPRSAMPKIGASPSLLTQMMLSDPFMPTMCWVAPEMPSAM